MTKHCCNEMDFFLAEDKIAISYLAMYREYTINLKDSNGSQLMLFCPWCGRKLPKDLRDEWFDILEDEMGLDIDNTTNLPKEFLTDEWWRNRKI